MTTHRSDNFRSIVLATPPEFERVPAGMRIVIADRLPYDLSAFRPSSFLFDDADDWAVCDFRIGLNSQFKRDVLVSAREFASAIRHGGCETIQRGMEYAMTVTPQKAGLRFRCEMIGAWS